jgi:MerR family transcriptional regulator/heat shock protein HspR
MNERHQHAVYVISVFAELAGVHPQTLRNYERTGLLRPRRTAGGSRRFSDADLAQLQRIQQLTNEGINLEGVKRILELEREVAELRDVVAATQATARQQLFEATRSTRRDLVPLTTTDLAVFIDQRRSRRPR